MTRQELLVLKQQGLTYAELGKLLGVSRQRVQQLFQANHPKSGTCARCNKITERLHLHHLSYSPEQTETICNSCHSKLLVGNSRLHRAFASSNLKGPVTLKYLQKRFACSYQTAITHAKRFNIIVIKKSCRPISAYDWGLPNIILATIWDSLPPRISELRRRFGDKPPLIDGRGYRDRKKTLPDWFQDRVKLEENKRDFWFANGCLP